MIVRLIDLIISIILILLTIPIQLVVFIVLFFDVGSPLFIQERVGKNKKLFKLFKFRTMAIGTKSVGTHLVDPSSVTRTGTILRKTKLDELPQLYNVFLGQMSMVGPRPCLPTQHKVIAERESLKIFQIRPGITGLSQIRGIDMSDPIKISKSDLEMIESMSIFLYFKYIIFTALGKGSGDRIVQK